MKTLIILTSHDTLGNTGQKTGFWLEEFAAPYYALLDAGVEVTIASPLGGQPPIDPKSNEVDFQTASTKRFEADKEAQTQLAHSIKLADIQLEHYDSLFYPGGHGPLWDLTQDRISIGMIESMIAAGKPVAAVCHAPAVFLNAKNKDGGALIAGSKMTGFSNSEEEAVALTEVVPFLLEDELNTSGAHYSKGEDWHPYVVTDGLFITGQNPASSEDVAKELIRLLKKK